MSKLLTASINLSKVNKEKLFTSKNLEKWLNISIWLNDEPDKFGNDCSIQQKTDKGEDKIFLGNGKYFVKRDEVNNSLPPGDPLDDPNDNLPF